MRKCEICGRGSKMGGTRKLLRGHYNPVNWSRKYPNLQWAKVPAKGGSASGGNGRRLKICMTCLRNMAKKHVIKTPAATKSAHGA